MRCCPLARAKKAKQVSQRARVVTKEIVWRRLQVDELVDELGAEVGSVNVFVSHAWNTKWSTLMKMLERLDRQLHVEGTVTVGDPSSASHPAYMRAKGREAEREAQKAAGFLANRMLSKKMSMKEEQADAPAASTATEEEGHTDTGPGPVTESFDPEAAAAAYRGYRPGPVTESAGTSGASGAGAGRNAAYNREMGGGAAAAAAAVAATNLGPGKGAFEGRRIHYFLDVFAVRQLYSTEKHGVHTHHDVPDMQFPFVVRKAQIFAMACYPWFQPVALTRSWCMNELAYAIQYGKPVEIMFGERFYDIAECTKTPRACHNRRVFPPTARRTTGTRAVDCTLCSNAYRRFGSLRDHPAATHAPPRHIG